MKTQYFTKIQCTYEGQTGCYLTDIKGNLLTKIYPDSYSLFTSEEYKRITNQ